MAWAPGTNTIANQIKGGSFEPSPASVNTTLGPGEQVCFTNAESCSKKYNGCCVPSYGKFVFVQQWIQTKPTNRLTIHGLWPGDCLKGLGPSGGCDESRNYNNLDDIIKKNELLHNKLILDMPSDNDNIIGHWKHQWGKHGTCISDIKPGCHNIKKGQDAIRYFKMTTELYDQYKITTTLYSKGIVPRASAYSKTKILDALKEWGNHLSIHCVNNKLVEIRVYLLGKYGQKFKPSPNPYKGNCSETIEIPIQKGTKGYLNSRPTTPTTSNSPSKSPYKKKFKN